MCTSGKSVVVIAGSRHFEYDEIAAACVRARIVEAIQLAEVVVTGDAGGPDTWAVEAATRYGIPWAKYRLDGTILTSNARVFRWTNEDPPARTLSNIAIRAAWCLHRDRVMIEDVARRASERGDAVTVAGFVHRESRTQGTEYTLARAEHHKLTTVPYYWPRKLTVYTARVDYAGGDRINVARKRHGDDTAGLFLAPSWTILKPVLDARETVKSGICAASHGIELRAAVQDFARRTEAYDAAWEAYRTAYRAEMIASYRDHRREWEALLDREEATLVCYCTESDRCHRTLLAAEILPRMGARYGGER